MKKFVCKVCGYIYEGDAAPAECPVCHAKSNMFEEVKGDLTLAAEHEYGIYAKTVKNNPDIPEADKQYIFDQLKANFNGECSEVGMYLCMARIAHREGYPEIGLYWEKAAYEEAEHAAKFAEMLGEDLEPNMKATTKDNLKWRVDCEFGATQGKFDLAKCAKKNNLDAIHDTVHEMAKDEARHGRALKGLLERYFKGNLVPAIWKQSCKSLSCVYAAPFQEQTRVRIIVCRIGKLYLRDPLFIPAHRPFLLPLK